MRIKKLDFINKKNLDEACINRQYEEGFTFMWGYSLLSEPVFYMVNLNRGRSYPIDCKNFTVWCEASSILVQNSLLFICGGKGYSKDVITNECYTYNVQMQHFKKIEHMWDVRYGFSMWTKGSKVYVFGGRLHLELYSGSNKCEEFDLITGKWTRMASMNAARFKSKAFGYRDQIWVVGGCVEKEKSGVIDIYDLKKGEWTTTNFKIPRYFEIKTIFNYKPDKLLFMTSFYKKVYVINLIKGTIKIKGSTKPFLGSMRFVSDSKRKILHCFCFPYGLNDNVRGVFNFSLSGYKVAQILVNNPLFMRYHINNCHIEVPHIEKQKIIRLLDGEDNDKQMTNNYLFGTYDAPFIISIDAENHKVKIKPMPLSLQASLGLTAIRISKTDILFVGGGYGCDCVTFNIHTKHVERIECTNFVKFFSALALYRGSVFTMGGIHDGRRTTICERYDFKKSKWVMSPSLLKPIAEGKAFIVNDILYLSNSDTDSENILDIQIYNDNKNRWELAQLSFGYEIRKVLNIFTDKDKMIFLVEDASQRYREKAAYYLSLAKGLDLSIVEPIACRQSPDISLMIPPSAAATNNNTEIRLRRNSKSLSFNNKIISFNISLGKFLKNKLSKFDFEVIADNKLILVNPR